MQTLINSAVCDRSGPYDSPQSAAPPARKRGHLAASPTATVKAIGTKVSARPLARTRSGAPGVVNNTNRRLYRVFPSKTSD